MREFSSRPKPLIPYYEPVGPAVQGINESAEGFSTTGIAFITRQERCPNPTPANSGHLLTNQVIKRISPVPQVANRIFLRGKSSTASSIAYLIPPISYRTPSQIVSWGFCFWKLEFLQKSAEPGSDGLRLGEQPIWCCALEVI